MYVLGMTHSLHSYDQKIGNNFTISIYDQQ